MRPYIWYSVLPSNDGNTDISSGTRQRWDHMLPILKHIGLLQEKQQATNEFEVFATKWNEFVRQMPGSSKLHFVSFRKKGKAKQFYLCLVDSTFKSPTKQLEAVSNKKFAFEELTYLDYADKELRKMLVAHISKLSISTLMAAPTPPTPPPIPFSLASEPPIQFAPPPPASVTTTPPPEYVTTTPSPLESVTTTPLPESITNPPPESVTTTPTPPLESITIPPPLESVTNLPPPELQLQPEPIPPPPPPPAPELAEVNFALALNFQTTPRLDWSG